MEFILPIAPRTKKNHGRVVMMGRYPRVLPSKQYIEFEDKVVKFISACMPNFETIDYPINLKALYYQDADRKSDLTGFNQALHDALVKAGVLLDDNHKIIVRTDGSEVFVDRENPRVEIKIERLEGYDHYIREE